MYAFLNYKCRSLLLPTQYAQISWDDFWCWACRSVVMGAIGADYWSKVLLLSDMKACVGFFYMQIICRIRARQLCGSSFDWLTPTRGSFETVLYLTLPHGIRIHFSGHAWSCFRPKVPYIHECTLNQTSMFTSKHLCWLRLAHTELLKA